MTVNLQIDNRLLVQAAKLGHHRSKKEAVMQALAEYVKYLEQIKMTDLFGKIDFDPKYDYKTLRQRKTL